MINISTVKHLTTNFEVGHTVNFCGKKCCGGLLYFSRIAFFCNHNGYNVICAGIEKTVGRGHNVCENTKGVTN